MAVKLYKPVGTERLSKEGYRERKIHDGLPLQARWRAVHLIEWEALHGAVPAGHCLRCLSTDVTDTRPANWEPIPRAVNLHLNQPRRRLAYADAEPETRPLILAAAKVSVRARKVARA